RVLHRRRGHRRTHLIHILPLPLAEWRVVRDEVTADFGFLRGFDGRHRNSQLNENVGSQPEANRSLAPLHTRATPSQHIQNMLTTPGDVAVFSAYHFRPVGWRNTNGLTHLNA